MFSFKKAAKLVISGCIVAALSCSSVFALNVGTVTASSTLNFRASASTSSAVLGKLASGSKVAVLAQSDGWSKVAINSTTGYVSSEYLKNLSEDADFLIGNGVITGSVVNIRSTPSTAASVLFQAKFGATMDVIGIQNGWYKIKSNATIGYVHPDYIVIVKSASSVSRGANGDILISTASQGSPVGATVVETAKAQIGKPYSYGSKGPNAFDCSGLTYYAYKQHGYTLGSSSASQYASTARVSRENLQPGDLVFFSNSSSGGRVGHVGIYVGNDQYIHAPSAGKTVCYASLSSSWSARHYIGGGRVA